MVRNNRAASTPLDIQIVAEPGDGTHAIAYDDRGMPNTKAAARAMPAGTVRNSLVASLAKLQRRSIAQYSAASSPAADGSPTLDSIEVVWLIAEFSKPFGSPVVDVSRIPDRTKWSSAAALAALIVEGVK